METRRIRPPAPNAAGLRARATCRAALENEPPCGPEIIPVTFCPMSGRQGIVGLLVGLVGAALAGYGLFSVLTSASCTDPATAKACLANPGVGAGLSGVWMIPVGVVAAIAGMVLGGGFLVFAALFMAIGGGALAVGLLGLMPDMPTFPWLFGGLFFASGLLPLFIGFAVRRSMAGKQALATELMVSGRKGVGTIIEVRDTGVTTNDNPRVVIRMRIAPFDNGPPVERSKTVTVSRVAVPRVGERYPAWFNSSDPEKWMFATDMEETAPAEIRDMFARARAAGETADDGEAEGPVAELARLSDLWKDGALTDSEFADAKARLLPRIGR